MSAKTEATVEDLLAVPDNAKAELVDGEVVSMSPTGGLPGYAADEIYASLREYTRRTGSGLAVGDNRAFVVNLPKRKSFSPDAAYYTGSRPTMRYFDGAPVFAVEVRSENDYGGQAERGIARKRADYFAAGTLVVWDVDLLAKTWYASTAWALPTPLPSTGVATWPRPSRPCPAGRWRSMICFSSGRAP